MMNDNLNRLLGLEVIKDPFLKPGTLVVGYRYVFVGPPMISREVYDIFHQGEMQKWYDYIGESKDSVYDFLFGYR